jgi:para-aminobenzoate synthetase / 4-amino-4-deoxychorismate lyase
MLNANTPFVLFDDARRSGAAPARLYRGPIRTCLARQAKDLPPLLASLRQAQTDGLHVAGYLGYEAGHFLAMGTNDEPENPQGLLAWFGIFQSYQELDRDAMAASLPPASGAYLSPIQPDITRHAYGKAFATVQNYIAAGDIYQANLTIMPAIPWRCMQRCARNPKQAMAELSGRGSSGCCRFRPNYSLR